MYIYIYIYIQRLLEASRELRPAKGGAKDPGERPGEILSRETSGRARGGREGTPLRASRKARPQAPRPEPSTEARGNAAATPQIETSKIETPASGSPHDACWGEVLCEEAW